MYSLAIFQILESICSLSLNLNKYLTQNTYLNKIDGKKIERGEIKTHFQINNLKVYKVF